MSLKAILLVILLPLLFACQNDTVDGQLTMRQGEQVTLPGGRSLSVAYIMDSRCPGGNVQCIRAGEAYVVYSVAANAVTQRDTLCIGADCPLFIKKANKATYSLSGQPISIELLEIYREPYRALFKIQ